MGRLFQPVVLTMPRYHHGGKPSLEEIAAALFEPTRCSVFSPRGSHSEGQWSEFQPLFMRRFTSVKKPWIQVLDMNGFQPRDLKIATEGDSLVIHARKEVKQGEYFDVKERKRVVTIPDGVDRKLIACKMNQLGHFVIKGTFECDNNDTDDKHSESTKSAEMDADDLEKKLDNSAEQTCEQNGNKTDGPEDDKNLKGNHRCDSKPLGEYVVTDVADEHDAESDKQSIVSIADFIVDCLAGLGKQNTDSTRSRSPVPSEEFVVLADSNNDGDSVDVVISDNEEKQLQSHMDLSEVTMKDGNTSFNVKLSLKDYPADKINVQCKDNTLVVDAKREWKDGDMLRSQSVHRMYQLPENAVKNEARASVDGDGKCSITVLITEKKSEEKVDITVVQE